MARISKHLIGYGVDFIINIKPVGNAPILETMHEHFLLGLVKKEEVTLGDGTGRGYFSQLVYRWKPYTETRGST